MVGHMNGSGKGMHGLNDMQAAFSSCRHGGMSKACACGCKAMGVMPWLGCLGKSSNESLLGAGHGLGEGHVIKASLPQEGLVASISCWW